MPRHNKKKAATNAPDFFTREEEAWGRAGNLATTHGGAHGTASAKLRQAEWSGEHAWSAANHPKSAKQSSWSAGDWSAEAQLKDLGFKEVPYWCIITRDAENGDTMNCMICPKGKQVTQEHLESKTHKERLEWYPTKEAYNRG
jgi:hypothetical protein